MDNIQSIYFLGIGGIGMSNLARYFMSKGKKVAGYDRTETLLTKELVKEGADIHYTDDVSLIPDYCKDKNSTLIVYTPAVPSENEEVKYFRENGFPMQKRAQVLGTITKSSKALCCAGTHGKTTTSSMLAHILKQSHLDCNAFLGGILKNYSSNLLLSDKSEFTVIEADEYDRSFHWLHPYMALITSVDPDHLDIYGTEEEYLKSFEHFTSLIQSGGALVMKHNTKLSPKTGKDVRVYTYSMDKGDFHAENIKIGNGEIRFDFITPTGKIDNIQLGVPVKINIENGIGSMALAWLNGATADELRHGMATFQGAKRRFDFLLKTDKIVMIDDYAHHPEELAASITSVKELYPDRKVTGIFQPHLYTRTRDFAPEFARSLSLLDELILLDIYPAREKPIEGVTSRIIFDEVTCPKTLCNKEELLSLLDNKQDIEVLLTIGAGDIDRLLEPIRELLIQKQQ
ncbi:UDP-N-acetylmuramate--alanine ligase [Dysgonomonas sp. PFB1-18]|uniref:UDP-N-acetylmuramate--L-alanine ligase n=1 Tax=unclassified Dysgonomonas TaxID=2630389 RepID=UPI002475A261|nr:MULTISPECIES: UDP-N-acetylmuramate--L-alanine ligase [unclassified Dysgonomonas]MDH6307458.1 UDP-N-acetylmuramate--alanine ligase [Dysgonomonas sp. PF1-14]MDH6337376.1 UDP-N-acetylmuramate--alanine ligase [Dysgonomonas sp. PF1-16]MDH6379300.1 UDP-N-acetylmuramate--alanine ligase [Dysgonomonas sp. PFB1-18]MDH6396062.1 UDP-N-acetylmuramate--alanine ligase [Dysgonomonas sp. PF1-23]